MAIDKNAIKEFTKRWKGIGYEKGDTQQYWLQLLRALGYAHSDDVKFEHHLPGGGFIDVWIRDAGILVEQKSIEIDLDKPEPRQGKMKTPLEQAMDYVVDLPLLEQPRFIITCNFRQFRIYDREKYGRSELADNAFEFTLEELASRPDYLNIIVDPNNSRLEKEKQVSIEAGRLIGQLYDLMREGYIDPDSDASQHALNVLCVRLVFCLYCEDSDLFPKDAFYNYLKDVPAQNVRMNLKRLFKALDTPHSERDPYDTSIKDFPYVNGGLFKEDTEIPNFSEAAKDFLLHKVSAPVNWSQISPTIFGGIFESTLNPETRRKGGMHYTSPENIHKVIDPLFLDDLKKEFTDIRDNVELTPRQKKNRYKLFLDKLCSLKFFDPAAGSGNFLTETYLCLRKLEDSVLVELRGGQAAFGFEEDEDKGKRVSLNQFYGIEINDFAVTVAETALWISRLKANGEESMLLSSGNDFPLSERANIVHDNALRKDWNEILPASECSYIMGNPPFIGQAMQSREQSDEVSALFPYITNAGKLDYVAGWFRLAASYTSNTKTQCAFVSSNSICQGESVAALWKQLFNEGCVIDYAYTTFIWNNEAESAAHVHVVIIGFSMNNHVPEKRLFNNDGTVVIADNINGYLKNAPNVFIKNRTKCINSNACEVTQGSQPMEDGMLLFTVDEYREFIARHPDTIDMFKPLIGSREFLNDTEYTRYCLWLVDIPEVRYNSIKEIVDRIQHIKNYRINNSIPRIKKTADAAHLFTQIRQPDSDYLIIPRVSSERRKYIPIGYVSPEVVASDAVVIVSKATLYDFGLLSSQFHNAWMRVVAGRLKSDYRYAPSVYYNFIYPSDNPQSRDRIIQCAQDILNVRAAHNDKSLAQLYDPDKMPKDLLEAHKALDKAVEEAYGVDFNGDEEKIVAHLFNLYSEKTESD